MRKCCIAYVPCRSLLFSTIVLNDVINLHPDIQFIVLYLSKPHEQRLITKELIQ